MRLVWQHEQVEILVRLDQCIDDERGVVRRHVVVERAVREEQLALQVLGERLVRENYCFPGIGVERFESAAEAAGHGQRARRSIGIGRGKRNGMANFERD